MDYAILLILDAIVLLIATIILTYFFIKDLVKNKKKSEKNDIKINSKTRR